MRICALLLLFVIIFPLIFFSIEFLYHIKGNFFDDGVITDLSHYFFLSVLAVVVASNLPVFNNVAQHDHTLNFFCFYHLFITLLGCFKRCLSDNDFLIFEQRDVVGVNIVILLFFNFR